MIKFRGSKVVSLNIRTAFTDILKRIVSILYIVLLLYTSYASFFITNYIAFRVLFDLL